MCRRPPPLTATGTVRAATTAADYMVTAAHGRRLPLPMCTTAGHRRPPPPTAAIDCRCAGRCFRRPPPTPAVRLPSSPDCGPHWVVVLTGLSSSSACDPHQKIILTA